MLGDSLNNMFLNLDTFLDIAYLRSIEEQIIYGISKSYIEIGIYGTGIKKHDQYKDLSEIEINSLRTFDSNKEKFIYHSMIDKTTHIGRSREKFIPNNSASYFKASGGYLCHFQKMNAFFHRTARIEYIDGRIAEYASSVSSGNPKLVH